MTIPIVVRFSKKRDIEMLEYLPWSKATNENCLNKYKNGLFSVVDIELGGECNYNCVYCDSPDRNKLCTFSIDELDKYLLFNNFDWVYVCGLGEPTYKSNYDMLLKLLTLCAKHNLRCSMFTNLSNLTSELAEFIQDGILHIFYKYDSNNSQIIRALYGTKETKVQLNNIKQLKKLTHLENGMTNIAASIVPTRLNMNFVLPIVEECLNNNIFPLIGELELSGKGQMNYENLCLNQDELCQIKDKVENLWGERYSIPICPAVISGIHFNYNNFITVDEFSGLSCHWFWLEEPRTKKIIQLNHNTTTDEITNTILNYRDSCLPNVEKFLHSNDKIGIAFGGCGGDAHTIFREYLTYHRTRINDLS